MKEAKNVMHVGLERPTEMRRGVLNSAIGTIELLKRYEKVKKIKKSKDAHKKELRILFKDIKTLFKEIEEVMPAIELPREEPKRVERVEPVKVVVKKKLKMKPSVFKPMKIEKDEHMERLDRDLQALRDKIAKL